MLAQHSRLLALGLPVKNTRELQSRIPLWKETRRAVWARLGYGVHTPIPVKELSDKRLYQQGVDSFALVYGIDVYSLHDNGHSHGYILASGKASVV